MNDDQRSAEDHDDDLASTASRDEIERRIILKRLGALAALTPPAVVTMLMTAKSSAATP
jgi:hypothetical protein